MTQLEDIIRNNRNAFDEAEPSSGHTERFRDRLDEAMPIKREGLWAKYGFEIRLAAGFAVFVTLAVLFYAGTFGSFKNLVFKQLSAAELPLEVREMLEYYIVITDKKVDEIDELDVTPEESEKIKTLAGQEMVELDRYAEQLKEELAVNHKNERVKAALVLNRKKKAELLDKIIKTVKDESNSNVNGNGKE
ncbi:MAG: hypothetical protein JXA03_05930 [Bacteroidales bacterium]|nr:hypothetical protein [Bacteroidales bacterium]